MPEVHTEIDIDADPETVWEILTAFDTYPEWNPTLTRADGEPTEGATVDLRVEPPDARSTEIEVVVETVDRPRRLAWRGTLLHPLVFVGDHSFEIEPRDDGVRLSHDETFGGIVASLLVDEDAIERGYEAMNEALKDRAESRGE